MGSLSSKEVSRVLPKITSGMVIATPIARSGRLPPEAPTRANTLSSDIATSARIIPFDLPDVRFFSKVHQSPQGRQQLLPGLLGGLRRGVAGRQPVASSPKQPCNLPHIHALGP